jgi:hypothetical protein
MATSFSGGRRSFSANFSILTCCCQELLSRKVQIKIKIPIDCRSFHAPYLNATFALEMIYCL